MSRMSPSTIKQMLSMNQLHQFHPNFSGGLGNSPTTEVPYSLISDNLYGPSPPGIGTSTSSSAPPSPRSIPLQQTISSSHGTRDSIDCKTYSSAACCTTSELECCKEMSEMAIRRDREALSMLLARLHKLYGALNHLNAHVTAKSWCEAQPQWSRLVFLLFFIYFLFSIYLSS